MQFDSVLLPELADYYRRSGLWLNKSVFDVLEEKAALHGAHEVFIDEHVRLTYAQLKDKVERCAAYFRQIGLGRGDVVTIQLPNRVEFPIVFFALELIGAIGNTVNPDFRIRELEYILKVSGSRAYVGPRAFRDFDYVAMAKTLQAGNPYLTHIIIAGGPAEGAYDLDAGLAATPPIGSARVRMDTEAVFRMAFTSGTTGNPKCVLHSFNTTLYAAHLLNQGMRVTEDDVLLVYLPVGLNWGYICLLQAVLAGARAVLMEKFSSRPALEAIQREGITYIATAPASIVAMLNVPALHRYDTTTLRVVVTGGASAAIETIRAFRQHFKAHLIELYGMLETGFQSYTRFEDDPAGVSGTVGRTAGAMRLRIVDADHNDVPFGEIGELSTLGPSVHLGYHMNKEANATAFTADGWFRTGDLARYVDADHNIEITGRNKEIINRGGKKFFPREVEELLYTHPKILHAAMIGLPDQRLGERNCLCAVPKPGATVTLEEIVAFLRGEVADYKLPEMLYCLDELPLTGTGKLRRHVLREIVLASQAPS